jgi:hypothetical protein
VPKWQLVERFYTGLNDSHRQTMDGACAGTFLSKTEDEAWNLFDTLSENSIHLNSAYMDRKPTLMQRKLEANEARDTQNLAYQIQLLNQNMERLMSNLSSFVPNTSTSQASECLICQGNTHATVDCHLACQFPELVQADLNVAQGFRPRHRNDPFSNAYNEGWRKGPKFSWRQGNVSNSRNYK